MSHLLRNAIIVALGLGAAASASAAPPANSVARATVAAPANAAGLPGAAAPAEGQEAWYVTRTLLPGDVVNSDDVTAKPTPRPLPDLLPTDHNVVGLEAKRRLYPGRALTESDVGPASAVKASTPVEVLWRMGALTLELQGEALESGAIGDEIRVLNTATSRTLRGKVTGEGVVEVSAEP
jgi:flagellar basal body P-ring formation protein FlgA